MFVGRDEVRAPRIDRRLNYPLPSAGQESTEKQPPPRHGCRDPRPECDQRQPWPDGRVTPEPVGYSPQDCLHDHLTHRKGGEDPPRVGEPTPACVDGKQCEVQTERRHRGDEDSPGHEDSGMDQPVGAPSRCVRYAMYKRESEAGGARGNDSRRCEQTRVARRGSHGDARRRSDALADAVRQAEQAERFTSPPFRRHRDGEYLRRGR